MTTDERVALRRRLLDAARAIPGVEHAAWASNVPLQGTSTMSLFVPGIDSVARLGRFTYQSASADYFADDGNAHRARPVVHERRCRRRADGGRRERADGAHALARAATH